MCLLNLIYHHEAVIMKNSHEMELYFFNGWVVHKSSYFLSTNKLHCEENK